MYQLYRDRPKLVLLIVMANLALSTWAIYLDPVINNDGVIYLSLAELAMQGQWQEMFELFSWPFYSFFIAAIAWPTGLPLEQSALVLNTLFATSLSLAFVCIVAELSKNDRRIILIAIAVVLLFPSINKYRPFIIRDFGYLSCYLWSLYFLFRFCHNNQKLHLLGWFVFASIACLFRFEGIAFLLFAPYFLLWLLMDKHPQRKLILGIATGVIGLAVSIALIWYVDDKYTPLVLQAQSSGKQVASVWGLFFLTAQEKLGVAELNLQGYLIICMNTLAIVLYELIRRMAVFYFLFSVFAVYKGLGFDNSRSRKIWLLFVAVNFLLLFAFGLYSPVLPSRYTMATALSLLILTPFVIDLILRGFATLSLWKRCLSSIALLVLTVTSLDGLDLRTKKAHIKQAGIWVAQNAEENAKIYSNDPLLAYYSGVDHQVMLKENYSNTRLQYYLNIKHLTTFDYVAFSVNPTNKFEFLYFQTLAFMFGRAVHIEEGYRERKVFVFETPRSKMRKMGLLEEGM